MKRTVPLVGLVLGVLAMALPAAATQPQQIRIDSILYGIPDPAQPGNPNALAVAGCFAISGAVTDEGGDPLFDASGNVIACGNGGGIGGNARFDGQGHLKTGDPNVVQATHRMFGRHGEIEIKFEAQYGPITQVGNRLLAFGENGHWQITCGTGAYSGIQGQGASTAVADFTDALAGIGPVTVPHVDTGVAHLTQGAGGVC